MCLSLHSHKFLLTTASPQPLPVRILRNVLNRFWGNNVATNAESSDDDDDPGEELREEEGVD